MTTPGVDDFALIGITPIPVPAAVLLRALLAQQDHYVAPEILALEAASGVQSRSGFAAVVRWDGLADLEHLLDTLPPTLTFRVDPAALGIGAVFYREYPTAEITAEARVALKSMPEAQQEIALAIRRWTFADEYDTEDRLLPWARSYRGTVEEASEQHLTSARRGDGGALIALALGRMNTDHPVSVGGTRWMFPAGTP